MYIDLSTVDSEQNVISPNTVRNPSKFEIYSKYDKTV